MRNSEELRSQSLDPTALIRTGVICGLQQLLEFGYFHADPHPGNLFVLDDGRLGLIDFGQVKQISVRSQRTLGKVMMALADRTSDTDPAELAGARRN